MEELSHSPDLNIVENMSVDLKLAVQKTAQEELRTTRRSEWEFIKHEWNT